MRIGVVGAGGIGGFLAGALARSGIEVAVVARGEHLAAIARDGLHVESDLGTFDARVDASDDLRRLGRFDALLLTFKAHQWPEFVAQLEPFSASDTTIVTMQNGLPFWYVRRPSLESVDPGGRIASLFPDERIVGAAVHVSGHIARPGCIRQSGGVRYVLGAPRGGEDARTDALVAVMRAAGLAPEADSNIRATVWLKLVNNAGLNPVSALRGLTIKPMLKDPQARADVHELMEEALHVGQAMGVVKDVDIDARIAYAARLDDVKTSMLQDYERGRPLEDGPILGALIELAQRYGVEVPKLRAAHRALHA
ncbi:MAG TPA: 2-dehydropantoate 2-reductase [Candidatus Acidoferrales bacterium]|jgi:2-dehydropantoate 2-reductase|nr:2-dehydropantoate 2-reductase [Candidatus Acidoferrales bacterium]